MEEYTDTTLVECDRESAQTKSSTDNSRWTNDFNNTINLDAGDRVSVYSSFICERGANQPNSVEFKGQTLGQKTLQHLSTETESRTYSQDQTNIIDEEVPYTTTVNLLTEVETVKDNEVNILVGYYKTLDLLNYVQLPRRFIPDTSTDEWAADEDDRKWNIEDSVDYGRVNREPYDVGVDITDVYGYVKDDYTPVFNTEPVSLDADRATWATTVNRWILKNDGSRFTIMRRCKTFHYPKKYNFTPTDVVDPRVPTDYFSTLPNSVIEYENFDKDYLFYLPPYYARDPETFNYYIYKEKVKISLKEGFNSSQYVSEEITRQLRDTIVKDTETITHGIGTSASETDPNPQCLYPLLKTAESTTYKVFPTTNDRNFNEDRYDRCLNNDDTTENGNLGEFGPTILSTHNYGAGGDRYIVENSCDWYGSPWYESLEYIAMKRPEIYQAGSLMNTIYGHGIIGAFPPAKVEREGIITDIDYTQANCRLLANYVEAQELYPELFSQENIMNMYEDTGTETTNPYYRKVSVDTGVIGKETQIETITMNATIQNSRFFHMNYSSSSLMNNVVEGDDNRFPDAQSEYAAAQLGCSYYDFMGTYEDGGGVRHFNFEDATTVPASQDKDAFRQSLPFLIYYDPTLKEQFYDEPDNTIGDAIFLTYGFMGKTTTAQGDKIVIYTNYLKKSDGTGCGLPPKLFESEGGVIQAGRKFGFDRHWNAWGTCAVALTSGIPSTSAFYTEHGGAIHSDFQFKGGIIGNAIPANNGDVGEPAFNTHLAQTNVNPFYDKVYLGAPAPALDFDGSHFSFTKLHNELNAGDLTNDPAGGESTAPPRIVYKLNPKQAYNNYSPVQFPYEPEFTYEYLDDSLGTNQKRTQTNKNISPWAVFDCNSGIYLEDMGYTKEQWESGMWKRLGFTYEQFHPDTNDRLTRHSDQPESIKFITTNSKIDAVDTKTWNHNQFDNIMYDGTISRAQSLTLILDTNSKHIHYRFLPQIVNQTESIKILAQEYPIRSFKGYYAIRSDIIPTAGYVGGARGNTNMSIVGVVNKFNNYGDFFTGTESSITHTITKPLTIASATIQICDPDGTPATISERSSIIFKIQKARLLNKHVARDLFAKLMKQVKDDEEEK